MLPIHNCHVHTFTIDAVPDGFLPFGLMRLARTELGGKFLGNLLRLLWPDRNDRLDRLAAFLNIGELQTQREIFEYVIRFYPASSRFVLLSLDLDFLGAGKAPEPFEAQLETLCDIKEAYPNKALPFVCADPRRHNYFKIVRDHIEKYNFQGIKLYPSLGFDPSDKRLWRLYAYAEAKQIPIVSHCSRGGIYYQGPITSDMAHIEFERHWFYLIQRKRIGNALTNPEHYRLILQMFPKLRLCLAHYGGSEEWLTHLQRPWPDPNTPKSWLAIVNEYIRTYPNVYTDISFTAFDRRLWPLIKVLMYTPDLKERILYGSDYYMVRTAVSEREFSINLRAVIGEAAYNRMARTNPATFLRLTYPKSAWEETDAAA